MKEQRHYPRTLLATAGAGAMVMYLFDPRTGRRRRTGLRKWLMRSARLVRDGIETTWRDARNRGQGLLAEGRAWFDNSTVSDEILVERVRAQLGSLVRHPSSIEVCADHGRVVLGGSIVSSEVDQLLDGVDRVKGVEGVENRLRVYEKPGHLPELQGDSGRPLSGNRFELWQENWSPTVRASVGLAGVLLAAYGLTRRAIPAVAFATVGAAVVLRAFVNRPWNEITGVGGRHGSVDVNKTVRFEAPLENVFAFWTRYAEFPQYTKHVREVVEQGNGHSHWRVIGPAGIETTWNAAITKLVPNRELAWQTEQDSLVRHAGALQFRDSGDGTTTMHLKITYNPPAGVIGHGMARLIGCDLKTLLEEDLLRIKTVLDKAVIPRDVQQRTAMLTGERFERFTTD